MLRNILQLSDKKLGICKIRQAALNSHIAEQFLLEKQQTGNKSATEKKVISYNNGFQT